MKIKIYIIGLLISAFCFGMNAQSQMEVKTIGGEQYYCYKVKKKETLYGISTKLKIQQSDIVKYNPSAKQGLKDKQVLLLPVSIFANQKNATQDKQSKATTRQITKITHKVEKGETLYGLSKMYDVTIEDLIAANPETNNGLKAGQLVTIPQAETIALTSSTTKKDIEKPNTIQPTTGNKVIYHKIKAGETLFSVSRTYNSTIESILNLNPGISAANFRYDEVIRVMPNVAKPVVVEKDVTEFHTYEAKKGDTFYSIARDNNVDVNDLIAANPGINKLKKGNIINIPVSHKEKITVDPSDIKVDNKSELATNIRKDKNSDSINVALILPFMLKSSSLSSLARNNTEFYKGFMLAVDSVRKQTKKHINIYAYDNANSLAHTDSILSNPLLKRMDMIVAPSESKQLAAVNRFCNDNKIVSINALSVKDEAYVNNPYAFQSNIPPTFMSAEIFDWFDKQFKGHKIVFLNDESSEKKDIFDDLKKHFSAKAYSPITVNINSDFNYNTLSDKLNPGSKYVIIPSSSSKETLAKMLPVLKHLKQDRIDIDFALFGYPEYCAYLLEYQSDLHKVNTYIYSRFFYDESSHRTKQIESIYHKWYGEDMRYTVPRMGILGFDTGKYFLSALAKGNDPFGSRKLPAYNGIQTSFKFERTSNWSGFINKELQFIHFTPHSTIEKCNF